MKTALPPMLILIINIAINLTGDKTMQGLLPSNLLSLVTRMIFLGACLTTASAYAYPDISFTSYRIALDKENRQQSLTLRNKGKQLARCTMGFTHYQIAADGKFVKVKTAEEVINTASSMIRYSPSRVTIPKNSTQTVRIALKRSKDMKDGEYVSHLKISCKDDLRGLADDSMVGVIPTVNYNIPVVVRIGDLSASISLSDAKISPHQLTVDLNREGSRSVYGAVTVTDINSGDVIGNVTQISVYKQVDKLLIKVPLTGKATGAVLITFDESGNDKPIKASLKL